MGKTMTAKKTQPAAPKPEKDLSPAEWDEVKNVFSGYFGSLELLVDGYQISLQRSLYSKNRLCVMTYVDGAWKGIWDKNSPQCIKFARRKFLPRYSKADIQKLKRSYSKKDFVGYEFEAKGFTVYQPTWFSFNELRRHFRANNKSLELVKKD